MKFLESRSYASIADSDQSEESEEIDEKIRFLPWTRLKTTTTSRFICLVSIINILVFILSISLFWSSKQRYDPQELAKKVFHYSPIIDRIDLSVHEAQINGTLFPPREPSIGRQLPNTEADKIWAEIELTRTIPITADEVRKLGKDPATVAKFEDSFWHLGPDAYMAQIDVFHQLHCLNSLRKLAYPEIYGEPNTSTTFPELFLVHHNHCIDILMQHIMCQASPEMYTMQWVETQTYPFPDFSINKKCKNFWGLVDWRKENGVDTDMWLKMRKPDGIEEVPLPPEFIEMKKNSHRKDNEEMHDHHHN
ncbi:hypothetical protein BP6252_10882 [Coleophoma cylindrospora]|uniref:Tat pathway signal sequence n=1 Tax=Coleophoma cylindrospora TaxID=1849047 RepID=A0A3D8QNH0_9HELO|nr:hypothetical protein BP6252_10882 [Coleophoma cylindrospora]